MAIHGELIVQFVIHNDRGTDLALTRPQAKELYLQLQRAFKEVAVPQEPKRRPQPRVK